jgi:hypothetical protein
MKGGNSDHNGSNLDKDNILKPTFNSLTEEGCKVFEALRGDATRDGSQGHYTDHLHQVRGNTRGTV